MRQPRSRRASGQVAATEPNCLSYEWCDSNADPTKAIIYERYVSKADLDGPHQETLKAFGLDAVLASAGFEKGVDAEVELHDFTEANLGYMSK